MAIACKCDRCKKMFDPSNSQMKVHSIKIGNTTIGGSGLNNPEKMDLCDSCFEALNMWLHEYETEETSDTGNEKIFEGDDILVKPPWEPQEIRGYSAAFCKCGYILHIKTPKIKKFYKIKCPKCGFVARLFCGQEK